MINNQHPAPWSALPCDNADLITGVGMWFFNDANGEEVFYGHAMSDAVRDHVLACVNSHSEPLVHFHRERADHAETANKLLAAQDMIERLTLDLRERDETIKRHNAVIRLLEAGTEPTSGEQDAWHAGWHGASRRRPDMSKQEIRVDPVDAAREGEGASNDCE